MHTQCPPTTPPPFPPIVDASSPSTLSYHPLQNACNANTFSLQGHPSHPHTHHPHTNIHYPPPSRQNHKLCAPNHATRVKYPIKTKTRKMQEIHPQPARKIYDHIRHQTTQVYSPNTHTHDIHPNSAAPQHLPVQKRCKPAKFHQHKTRTHTTLHGSHKHQCPREGDTSMTLPDDTHLFPEGPARFRNCLRRNIELCVFAK